MAAVALASIARYACGAVLAALAAGCAAQTIPLAGELPPLVYAGVDPKPRTLTVIDNRGGSAWPPTPRNRTVEVGRAGDDLAEFAQAVVADLRARGVPVSYSATDRPDLVLDVKLLYSRCSMPPGPFSGYEYNETSLQAELRAGDATVPIVAYFPAVTMPDEATLRRTCYEIPRQVIASEVAAEINRAQFGGVVPNEIVEQYGRSAVEAQQRALSKRSERSIDYRPALELGFTNNRAARPWLRELAQHGNRLSRSAAVYALGVLAAPDDLPLLGELYDSGADPLRFVALKSILEIDTLEAEEFALGVKASRRYRDGRIRPIVDLYDFPPSGSASSAPAAGGAGVRAGK